MFTDDEKQKVNNGTDATLRVEVKNDPSDDEKSSC